MVQQAAHRCACTYMYTYMCVCAYVCVMCALTASCTGSLGMLAMLRLVMVQHMPKQGRPCCNHVCEWSCHLMLVPPLPSRPHCNLETRPRSPVAFERLALGHATLVRRPLSALATYRRHPDEYDDTRPNTMPCRGTTRGLLGARRHNTCMVVRV